MEPVIDTIDLTKRYGSQTAVNHLTLRVNQEEIFGFLGPNGAGKTTTILMLLGLSEPTSGTARVCGIDPTREPVRVKRIVGYLPENVGFYEEMTGFDNVKYVARLNGMRDGASRGRIEEVLERVGLADEGRKRVGAYSRGMRQRLGIARALIHDPPIIFLDEPAAGLDPDNRRELQTLFKRIGAAGKTMLVSSHILTELEEYCTHAVLMRGGRVAAADRLERLVAGPRAARAFRLRAVRGAEEAEALLRRRSNVSGLAAAGPDLRFELACTDEEAAALLAELVAAGVSVAAFGAEARRFEDAYRTWSAEDAG